MTEDILRITGASKNLPLQRQISTGYSTPHFFI